MVKNYTCGQCGKIFSQKGHYTNHLNRKTPCKPIENNLIQEKVEEKLQELHKNGDIIINNLNLNFKNNNNNNNNNNMDNNHEKLQELSKNEVIELKKNMIYNIK